MSSFFFASSCRLPAPGPRDPDVRLADRADRPGADQLDDAAVVVVGVVLVAHLRRHALALAAASRMTRAS